MAKIFNYLETKPPDGALIYAQYKGGKSYAMIYHAEIESDPDCIMPDGENCPQEECTGCKYSERVMVFDIFETPTELGNYYKEQPICYQILTPFPAVKDA